MIWVLCEGVPFCVALDKIRPATPAETLAYINTRGPGVDPLNVDFPSTSSQQNIIEAEDLRVEDPVPGLVINSDAEDDAVPVTSTRSHAVIEADEDSSEDGEPLAVRRRTTSTVAEPDGENTPVLPTRELEEIAEDDIEEQRRKRLQRECLEDLPISLRRRTGETSYATRRTYEPEVAEHEMRD